MLTALATLTRPQPDAPHILLWILGPALFLLAAAAEITFLRSILHQFLRRNPAPPGQQRPINTKAVPPCEHAPWADLEPQSAPD